MRLTVLFAIAILLAGCGRQKSTTHQFQLMDYGIYDAVVVTKGNWKFGMPVEVVSAHGLKHRESTNNILANDGVYWGFRGKLAKRHQRPIRLRIEVIYPEFTLPNGAVSRKDTEEGVLEPSDEFPEDYLWYFINSCSFEWVPGQWTTKIFIDDEEVYSKSFEVTTQPVIER